jgi:dienelactone hydrolase
MTPPYHRELAALAIPRAPRYVRRMRTALGLAVLASLATACDGSRCETLAGSALSTDPPAQALAASPARCGMTPYAWLDDPTLGDVAFTGDHQSFSPSGLGVLFSVAKYTPPEPLHAVDLDVVGYTTQDRGKLITATAAVAYPTDYDATADLPVLLFLHGTAGFTDLCAPSATSDARTLVAAFAALGYVVVAPDYIGMQNGRPTGFLHPYLVGEATAIASLDAVRAGERVLAARADVTTCAQPRFVTLGGSQGGHAALWVDRLAPYYAPELEHDGVVATVPPADLEAEVNRALTQLVPASANTAAFFIAASDWYGTTGQLSQVIVPPLDTSLHDEFATTCTPGDSVKNATSLDQVFTSSLLSQAASGGIASVPTWGCMVTENGLLTTSTPRAGAYVPSYGILWVLGGADTLVSTPIEQASFDTLCQRGMPLQYLECVGASHGATTFDALPEILDFLADRVAKKPMDPATTCQRTAAVTCRGTP